MNNHNKHQKDMKKKYQVYTVYIPENVDPYKLVKKDPIPGAPFKDKPKESADLLAYFLGVLGRKLKNGNRKPNLCSKTLQKKYHRDYDSYYSYLREKGIVEMSGHSKDFHKCKQYWFTEGYNDKNKLIPYFINFDRLIKKHFRVQRERDNYIMAKSEYEFLYNWIDRLSFEVDLAEEFLLKYFEGDEAKVIEHMALLWRLEDQRRWTWKKGNTNRLYTPISNIKSEVRKMMKCDGEPLVELDIKSSIPFFSLVLLNRSLIEQNEKIKELLFDSNKDLFRRKDINDLYCGIRGSGTYYKDSVLEGDIYEDLVKEWNQRFNTTYNRKRAKTKLLSIMNSPTQYDIKERNVLQEFFPYMMQLIERLNKGYHTTKNGKGIYEKKEGDLDCPFSMFTQKLEAWFVLDVVCKEVSEAYPDCPLYTIHDAILTTPEYVELVKKYMKKRAEEILSLPLRVEIK